MENVVQRNLTQALANLELLFIMIPSDKAWINNDQTFGNIPVDAFTLLGQIPVFYHCFWVFLKQVLDTSN